MRVDTLGRERVQLGETIMQAARPHRSLSFFFEASAHGRVRTRELDDIQEGALVQAGASRDHRDAPAHMNARNIGSRVLLVGGHRGLVPNLKHIDLVMGDPSASAETISPALWAPSASGSTQASSRARSDLPEAVGPTTAHTTSDARLTDVSMATSVRVPPADTTQQRLGLRP